MTRLSSKSCLALLMSLLFGRQVIGRLKSWNIGQQIREEGPQAHIAKRDTPTMGGLLVIASKSLANTTPRAEPMRPNISLESL